jgi:Fur family ferric uptake transcriptional regulator
MDPRSKYKTKQRESLLAYLESRPGTHITVSDVCAFFRAQGAPIAQSTLYRQLERLVDEGLVNKYVIDGSSPACFEYVGPDSHADAEVCFHCKCEKCGRLIHLHCEELEEIQGHILAEHCFRLDPRRTVLYGLCDACGEAET